MTKDYLYRQVADELAALINRGVLKPGDKLPSVRMLCKRYGIGMNTAKRIFVQLSDRALVYSKPQSGYFVSQPAYVRQPLAAPSRPHPEPASLEPKELITKVYSHMGNEKLTLFSINVPSAGLLPLAKLKKELIQATQQLGSGGAAYESLQGNVRLRRMVAQRSLAWGGNLHEDELVTTNGAMNALSFCLMALSRPGQTIAIESPCYPGILQLALSLGLRVLELPTHPITGLDMEALRQVLPKIDLCLVVPNFNTPLGSLMPDVHKKEMVGLFAARGVPIIEDDIYGDLHFGLQRPVCCKTFDTTGNVLWCGSLSKTLAPGYRVGWVAPGRYKEQILKLKLVHALSSPPLVQEAAGTFMSTGKYDKHLRQLRRSLEENCARYMGTVADYFPEGTGTSRPQGGLSLWIELADTTNTVKLYELALKQGICIAPGRMFTLQEQFNNCLRLSFGLPWTEELRQKLKQLGNFARAV
ncbi:PLP-dependent aminotransferase family protein [Pedobacter yulinensis]|uniref:PLP-dependent aminotransferase family protein n=1 Tax=Pedobacter yulinensis TaxID=2126353 RepID=A0A2T3HL33_9SPHI|nr:PLP-dependent aminotransferase family protein [Pedobacter yulinensis]PST83129.1 PLP-dependent aminotransferase family protein [Pedobacter yulinensis]